MARWLTGTEQRTHYRQVAFGTPVLQDLKLSIHERFSERPIDIHGQVVRCAAIGPDDAVADVGCGTGAFLSQLAADGHTGRLVGVDLADGVFWATAERLDGAVFVAADACGLPLRDDQWDVVCLQHMLGYVPDMAAACREAARVVRSGGTVVATANSRVSYPHALTYRERARELFGWSEIRVNTNRFCLENMVDVLSEVFENVQVTALSGRLRVPMVDYIDWFDQMTLNWGPLPSEAERTELRSRLATDWLPTDAGPDGCITEDKHVGIAWCQRAGRSSKR